MQKSISVVALICLCFAAGHAQERKPSMNDLAWLAGCWEGRSSKGVREEYWTKAAGGSIFGIGRAIRDGKTVEFEFMRIHEERGEIRLTARPSNQPEASFKLVRANVDEAIFENPQHDFPQRVIYRRQADGSLLARIEGEREGKQSGIDFPFTRVKCDQAQNESGANSRWAQAFEKLKTLAGKWKARAANGSDAYLLFETVSNKTALHERFIDEGNSAHSNLITVYYRDKDQLMATHFCSMNNQPRLRAVEASADLSRLTFSIIDITNLKTADTAHMYKVTYEFHDQDHFTTIWTMRQGGKDVFVETLRWERQK
ncbi:MAG: DUF6265 family protein [Acidobacteriota bacterium]